MTEGGRGHKNDALRSDIASLARLGISQAEMSRRLGVSRQRINVILREGSHKSIDTLP